MFPLHDKKRVATPNLGVFYFGNYRLHSHNDQRSGKPTSGRLKLLTVTKAYFSIFKCNTNGGQKAVV